VSNDVSDTESKNMSVISTDSIECTWEEPHLPHFTVLENDNFHKYKGGHLILHKFEKKSLLIHNRKNTDTDCQTIVNPTSVAKQARAACLALVRVKGLPRPNLMLRSDQLVKQHKSVLKDTNHIITTGIYRQSSHSDGRKRLVQKLHPFLANLDSISSSLLQQLVNRGFVPNTDMDVVVMVLNDGVMDVFLNYICSCRQHNISVERVLVFTSNKELVPLIEATGAMGIHADSFAVVSKEASGVYLDKTFSDMMWYKAFSVWLVLRLKFNVLFQDVDLVWFKDPFPYLHAFVSPIGLKVDSFWQDDGQRGIRYTPFYGNSGFYYIRWNPRTEHWAWSVVTAFDVMATSGSHQNVVTMRTIEHFDLFNMSYKILSLNEFPTGVKYHEDKKFMQGMVDGSVTPYNFHMCWTSNKVDKLKYFKASSMWYLDASCEHEAVRPRGVVFKEVLHDSRIPVENRRPALQKRCCRTAI